MLRRRPRTAVALVVTVSTALALTSSGSLAAPVHQRAGEYEPNDTALLATSLGPSGSSYAATLESEPDLDRFEFHVAERGTEVFVQATNTANDASLLTAYPLVAEVRDGVDEQVKSSGVIFEEESRSFSFTAAPGRYNVVVRAVSMDTAAPLTYTFTHTGATVDEPTMQARCDGAEDVMDAKRQKRRTAKKKLTRARFHGAKADRYCVAL